MALLIYIRGGGDLASGIALRLYRCGLRVAIGEIAQPLAVRRAVSFAEAIYAGQVEVEGVTGRKVTDPTDTLKMLNIFSKKQVPVMIDPDGDGIAALHAGIVVDARMLKQAVPLHKTQVNLLIGLGPGFTAGQNCHCAVETNRGPHLGRVIWSGSPEENTGIPEAVLGRRDRALYAPVEGEVIEMAHIGDVVSEGQVIAEVGGQPVLAPFSGVLRGLLHPGVPVAQGVKIGDVDPRLDPALAFHASEKSLAIAGGVLEAILSKPELRSRLWQ